MNKLNHSDIDQKIDEYLRKIIFYSNKIDRLRKLRKRIVRGYTKQPDKQPTGVKVKFSKTGKLKPLDPADFDDAIPSFGGPLNPAIE